MTGRRMTDQEQAALSVLADEWDRLPGDLKSELIRRWPAGYFAAARLARSEQVRREPVTVTRPQQRAAAAMVGRLERTGRPVADAVRKIAGARR